MLTSAMLNNAILTNLASTLTQPFMINAFIGGSIVAIAAGLIGYFVIIRKMVFASHALGHIGFPGATFALFLGLPMELGLGVFCTVGAIAIGVFGKKAAQRELTTGTVLAFSMGLGLFLARLSPTGLKQTQAILFGNILAISQADLVVFAFALAAVALAVAAMFRLLIFSSSSAELARVRGVNVTLVNIGFCLILGIVTMISIQVVGALLLFALVITPAAIAVKLTANPRLIVLLSTLVALFFVNAGLVLCVVFNTPASFVIVSLAFAGWLISRFVNR